MTTENTQAPQPFEPHAVAELGNDHHTKVPGKMVHVITMASASRKAADALFSASAADLNQAHRPGKTETP